MSVDIEEGTLFSNMPLVLYESIFETGTVTWSSQDTDGFALNAIEDTTFDFWTPTAVPAWVAVDYGSAVRCDCAGIASHTVGSVGATVEVQSSTDNSVWTTQATVSPTDDATILTVFPSVSARYWRIYVTGDIPSIGVIKLGERLIFPSGVLSGHVGINHANNIELLTNMSMGGQYLGNRVNRVGASTNIDFGLIETDFVENDMAEFEAHYNSGRTFFFASSPLGYPEDYGYCWRSSSNDELRPSYDEGGELMALSMGVSVYVEQ